MEPDARSLLLSAVWICDKRTIVTGIPEGVLKKLLSRDFSSQSWEREMLKLIKSKRT